MHFGNTISPKRIQQWYVYSAFRVFIVSKLHSLEAEWRGKNGKSSKRV